jgi:thiamine biosynthesis lipoprotein
MRARPTAFLPVLAVLLAAGLAGACAKRESPLLERIEPAMGTVLLVTVPEQEASRLDLAAYTARTRAEAVEELVDGAQPGSEIRKLNETAHQVRIPVSRDTLRLLKLAADYHDRSQGAFDVTMVHLEELWGFRNQPPPPQPLSGSLVRAALSGAGMEKIAFEEDRMVRFAASGVRIGLLGLAGGYAIDTGIKELREQGLADVLVNLGGSSIRCLGSAGPDRPWQVPLYNPAAVEERLGTISLVAGGAVATRRLYDRYVTIEGKRYGQLIDPRTGYPAEGTLGISVLAPTATEAYALATALLVAGLDDAPAILAGFPRCQALIIPDRQPLELWVTDGFRPHLTVQPRFKDQVNVLARAAEPSSGE